MKSLPCWAVFARKLSAVDQSNPIPAEGVILAVDYGRVRVGVARSDGAQVTSIAIGFLRRQNDAQIARAIFSLVEAEKAVGVVVGEIVRE